MKAVYESIVKLLYTPFLEIKLAAIKCLSFIVQIQMGNDFDGFDSLPSSRSFKLALYGSVLLKDLADSDEEIDGNINTVCSSMQLFSSAFSCNYILRKKIILDMAKLCINKDIKEHDARRVFGKIMKFLKSDFDNFMDTGNILSLICLYLKEDLQLHK